MRLEGYRIQWVVGLIDLKIMGTHTVTEDSAHRTNVEHFMDTQGILCTIVEIMAHVLHEIPWAWPLHNHFIPHLWIFWWNPLMWLKIIFIHGLLAQALSWIFSRESQPFDIYGMYMNDIMTHETAEDFHMFFTWCLQHHEVLRCRAPPWKFIGRVRVLQTGKEVGNKIVLSSKKWE